MIPLPERKILAVVCLVACSAVGIFGVGRLQRKTERLRTHAAELRRNAKGADKAHERAEHQRLTKLVAVLKRGDIEAEAALRAETEAARREVQELERRAEHAHALMAQQAGANQDNRDPELGLTRLEFFQQAGRATPAAAIQTLVWAAIKGDADALTASVALSASAREQANAWLARLPAEARERFPNPESLAVLSLTDEILKAGAVHVMDSTIVDEHNAFANVRRFETGNQTIRIPMQLGPGGWQVVVSERAIATLKQRSDEASP